MPSSTTKGPSVAVVGAGIAGLTLALWLHRMGVRCTIYERAKQLSPIGAGIQLAPNAVRLLERVGLAGLDDIAMHPTSLDIRRWNDGSVIASTPLGAARQRYGAPYLTIHRADLQAMLLDAVGAAGLLVRLGQRCLGISESVAGPVLHLEDGAVTADLIVGADGIGSAVRQWISPVRPRFSGVHVYRAVLDLKMPATINVWLGPGQHCVGYPVSGGRHSLVATVPGSTTAEAPASPQAPVSWQAPGDVADVRRAYAGWHPEVAGLLSAATRVTRWALHDLPALAAWSRGAVTLVGDAAHAVLPFGAQGANQAIESAASLAACLALADGHVPAALRAYESVRKPRLARVAAFTQRNADDHHLADGPAQQQRDAVLANGGLQNSHDEIFGYDAEAAVLSQARVVPAGLAC